MVYTREVIKLIVLVLSVTLPISCNGTENCYHPWKEDFGLHINDSISESFKSLSNIMESFLTITTAGQDKEFLKTSIKKCVMSSDCSIYTLLDKKYEKSLTFCMVVNGSETCYVSTCTCSKNARKRRAVSTQVHDIENKDKPALRKDFECTIKPIENRHSISTNHLGTESRTDIENLTKCINDSMLTTRKENLNNGDVPLRGVSTWLYAMLFFIGVGVGTFFGGFLSIIAFKRNCSCSRPVFGSNKKEDVDIALNADICFNEVTEYSEIPEYAKKADLEVKEKLLEEPDPRENQNNMTNVEYHECIPMHNNDKKCESGFEWRHIDVKEHAKGSVNECMEHPFDRFSNTPDIGTVDIKGQTAVTEGLYQTHTEPYFQLSSTRDTKDSLPDSIVCGHHDKYQEESANSKTLLITSEDVNYKNTDESTYQEGKEQPTVNEYFVLEVRS